MNRFCPLILVTFLLTLAACGGQDSGPVATDPAVSQATAAPQPTAVPAEPEALPPPVVVEDGAIEDGEPGEGPTGAAPETDPGLPVLPPWEAGWFGHGVQIHGNATYGDPAFTANVVRNQLGLDWAKVQIKWSAVRNEGPDSDQWFIYDGALEELHRHGVYIMASVVSAPAWTRAAGGENGPPDDFGLYIDFLNQLLVRHGDKIQAIEVWNEQNLDREWTTANGLVAADYVELLRRAHEAIKAHNPDIIVISGALSPTGVSDGVTSVDDFIYLDQLLAAGMLDHADCVGVHHNGYNIPPDVAFDEAPALPEAQTASFRGPFANPHHSWSFKTTVDIYADKVQALAPDMKLCVTEFGWASSEGYDEIPPTFEFARDNTLEEQAAYIVQAFQQMRASGDVWLAFLFNYDFGNKGWGLQDDTVPYSLVSYPDGVPRPAFEALANMAKER